MTIAKKPAKRVKAGTNRSAAADRRVKFAQAYIVNGGNATHAAITAGFSPKTATSMGSQLLTDLNVTRMIAELAAPAAEKAALSVERTLEEIARGAYSDPEDAPKWADKIACLDRAMRYFNMFKEDNKQRAPNLAIQIVLGK